MISTNPMARRRRGFAAAAIVAALLVNMGIVEADTPSKAPILIGVTGDLEGYAQSAGMPWIKVAAVWAQWINDNGGILGHPVTLRIQDTKSEPATGAKVLAALLNDPRVLAVVHGGDDTTAATAVLVADATAPVIGAAADDALGMNPNVFPISMTEDREGAAIGSLGVHSNKERPNGGVIYVHGAAEAVSIIRAGAQEAGGNVVYAAQIAPSASGGTDYSAQCLSAKAQSVGWMMIVDLPTTVARVAEACAQVDFRPTWVTGLFFPDYLKVPALDGMRFVLTNTLYSSPIPAAEQFRRAVAKYDPEQLAQPYFGEMSIMAWTALQLVAKAIETARPQGTEITRADVYRGLYSLKNETLGGLAPPLTFTRGKPTAVSCYFTAQIKRGKLIATSDKPVC